MIRPPLPDRAGGFSPPICSGGNSLHHRLHRGPTGGEKPVRLGRPLARTQRSRHRAKCGGDPAAINRASAVATIP